MFLELEKQLEAKQNQIKVLSEFIDAKDIMSQQVLAMSPDEDEAAMKMSRAEFLMQQVNLEVIESHGSQELQMSTQHIHLNKI